MDTAAHRWEAEAARKEEKEIMLKLLSRERQEMEEELEEARKSLTDKEVQIRRLSVEVEENSIIMVNLAKEWRDRDKEWAEKEKEWGKKLQVVDNTREKQLRELVQRAEIAERESFIAMLWDLIRTKQEALNRMRDDWDSTIQRVWKKNGIRGWKRELVGEERSRHLVRAGGYER